jgi:hypothetical protein
MRRVLIISAVILAVAGVGTASASFVVTNINQISPSVRAKLRAINGSTALKSAEVLVATNNAKVGQVFCPAGTIALSGGFSQDPNAVFLPEIGSSAPVRNTAGQQGWAVIIGNTYSGNGVDGGFYTWVVCGGNVTGVARDAAGERASNDGSLEREAGALTRQLRHR